MDLVFVSRLVLSSFGGGSCGLSTGSALESLAQFFLLVLRQRCAQNLSFADERLEAVEYFVRGRFANQDKKRRGAGGKRSPQICHEFVLNPNIAEGAGDCAGTCANGSAKQRIEEKQA